MENEDNKDHKKSNDNNWTKDFSALTNPPESYESDVAALVNSVLEILSNIVEQTAKAQQDVEHIKIQHNEANDDINFLQESEVPESGYNKFFPESNNTNVPPESKNTSGPPESNNSNDIPESKITNDPLESNNANVPPESNDKNYIPESKSTNFPQESNNSNVPPKSNDNNDVPESKVNGAEFCKESNDDIFPPGFNDSSVGISALINSVVEKLSNIAEQTAQAQQDMESIKILMEKDDKDDGFRDMPEPGAPGPGRPLPDFPTPNPDPRPDPNNDSKSGSIWDQDNSEKWNISSFLLRILNVKLSKVC